MPDVENGPPGISWGEDVERDCAELRRLESWGLYPRGHHNRTCPLDPCPHIIPPATPEGRR